MEGTIHWTVIRLGLAIFFTMNLMAFTMTMWSMDVYDVESHAFQRTLYEMFRWLSMLLAFPVLLLLGVPMLQNAIANWQRRTRSTDLLIAVAVFAAYAMSAVSVVRGSGAVYFEVGAMVLVMMTLGRWIEAAGRHKATSALDGLLTLLPATVSRIRHSGDDRCEDTIDSGSLRVGDELRVRTGERFAVDGILIGGTTNVDEQTFTGESRPISKAPGDLLLAGTVNLDGDIVVRVTAPFREGSFGRLLECLREARSAQGHYQRLADRVAAWFFPFVAVLAIAAFCLHWNTGADRAVQVSLSVLLIACPCALGLATPLAVWTALSVAVRHQVLFRSGETLERLASARAICFDKTGTLTTGTPQVRSALMLDSWRGETAWQQISDLAESSAHPFSRAVATWVQRNKGVAASSLTTLRQSSIRTVVGGGVDAQTCDGIAISLGSVEFVRQFDRSPGVELWDAGRSGTATEYEAAVATDRRLDLLQAEAEGEQASLVVAAFDGVPAVVFLVSEAVRKEAADALRRLSDIGDAIHVLSGDRSDKAEFLRAALPISGVHIECGLRPHDKVRRVEEIRRQYGTTVMVGDGINDAPALAVSDVGIAMGCGADVSRDSAGVCLLSNDLTRVPWAIELAGRTCTVIRQNLLWAFGYNSVGVAFAAAGWLNPALAAGLMIASSLLVISNSLRLLRDDPAKPARLHIVAEAT